MKSPDKSNLREDLFSLQDSHSWQEKHWSSWGRHGIKGRRLTGRIALMLRMQNCNRKYCRAIKPQGLSSGSHFLLVKLHFLKVSYSSQTTLASGIQVFKLTRLRWGGGWCISHSNYNSLWMFNVDWSLSSRLILNSSIFNLRWIFLGLISCTRVMLVL